MAQASFIQNLRVASRLLVPPTVQSGSGPGRDADLSKQFANADLWLTPGSVAGFDPADFTDLPQTESLDLSTHVNAFLEIAGKIPANKPATQAQARQARKHLEAAIKIVGAQLVEKWNAAQSQMLGEASAAARSKGWHVEQDEKKMSESLLGVYRSPRLRIRTPNREFVLDPVACFGSGHQGVVDLVVMPTYETAFLVAFKNGQWQLVSLDGKGHRRPFSRETLVNTISKLS